MVRGARRLCGLPADYFDVVYSVYAIGWTTDLLSTFNRISSYLRKGGVFIFSWDHPLIRCVTMRDGAAYMDGSYLNEGFFSYVQRGNPVTMQNRKLSTYINALAKTGFMVEQLVEETEQAVLAEPAEFSPGYYSPFKAKMFPLSFIIKARKT